MRDIDIIFRGKRVDNGEWITESETYIKDGDRTWLCDESNDVVKVIPETVGQYTGLCDKNVKRVFEGDILGGYLDDEFPKNYTIASVVWFGFGWFTKERNCCPDPLEKKDGEIYEVIGNIYDDKEILDVK